MSQGWWYMYVISALGRQRQEDGGQFQGKPSLHIKIVSKADKQNNQKKGVAGS